MAFKRTAPERFWERVIQLESGCWEYRGSVDRDGYGQFSICKGRYLAHRIAYALAVAPLRPGEVVRHTCDNPPCVRPDHLIAGTQAENMQDMVERGRNGKSPRASRAILSTDIARTIRASRSAGETRAEVARRFGVSRHTVTRITTNQAWADVA